MGGLGVGLSTKAQFGGVAYERAHPACHKKAEEYHIYSKISLQSESSLRGVLELCAFCTSETLNLLKNARSGL